MNILAAIGTIKRFATAKKLVGYAGLYPRYHQSGQRYTSGKLVSMGRRDLRWAMVEAAVHAVRHHPHWKRVYRGLELRTGRNKALVAIARKLLIAVWHVLAKGAADRFAIPEKVAATLYSHAYRVGVKNLPNDMSAREYTRHCMDRMGIGRNLTRIHWGGKTITFPPSSLPPK